MGFQEIQFIRLSVIVIIEVKPRLRRIITVTVFGNVGVVDFASQGINKASDGGVGNSERGASICGNDQTKVGKGFRWR